MKISTKLYICLAVVTAQVVISLGLLKLETQHQATSAMRLVDQNIDEMLDITLMKSDVLAVRVRLRDSIIAAQAGKTDNEIAQYQKEYKVTALKIDTTIDRLKSEITNPELVTTLEEVSVNWAALKRVVSRVEALDFAAANELLLKECHDASEKLIASFDTLIMQKEGAFKARLDNETATVANTAWITIAIMALLSTLTAMVFFRVIKGIEAGLQKAVTVSEQIGAGNLGQRIESVEKNEVGQLLRSLNTMNTGLRDLVKSIRVSEDSLTKNSSELGVSSDEMSKAALEQADATASMAAAVEELSVSIGQITDNSREAASLAIAAKDSAKTGGEILNKVVQSISSIKAAVDGGAESVKQVVNQSQEITQIVSTITEIADRTNLLALNAAIEAARAGESGRGFAVVADEVRKLAEQTKGATDKISKMVVEIQSATKDANGKMVDSVERVKDGIALAAQVSSTMEGIGKNAELVNQSIQAITSSMQEQTSVSQDIGRNVERVAQMTEENTATISQNKEMSLEVAAASSRLAKSVNLFKL